MTMNNDMRLQELIDVLVKLKESQMNTAFTNVSNVSIETHPMRQVVLEGISYVREIQLKDQIQGLKRSVRRAESEADDLERDLDRAQDTIRDQCAQIVALQADNDRLSIELRTLKAN